MEEESDLIFHAEAVVRLAHSLGHDLVVIGAAALAGHHYVRLTNDLDLGGVLSLCDLRDLAAALKQHGYAVDVREPDADDPLGGVIDIQGNFGQVQVVSFCDRFPAVIRDALRESNMRVAENSPLRIIPLPHLVVLKLYAGGLKSMSDIVEVLSLNEDADLDAIDALCRQYRIQGFTKIREELETR
ncbi:MAG: hypothetical protein ACOVMP_08420 [Chthoniobacterales bacterium]